MNDEVPAFANVQCYRTLFMVCIYSQVNQEKPRAMGIKLFRGRSTTYYIYSGYQKHENEKGTAGLRQTSGNGCSYSSRIGVRDLDSEVVLVLSTAALGYPKHNCRKHQANVLRDIAVPVVLVHLGVVVEDVLEDQDALEKNHARVHASDTWFEHEVVWMGRFQRNDRNHLQHSQQRHQP